MNKHDKIITRLQEHLDSALAAYNNPDWFVICAQGSQNYGLDDEQSDIDSKLLILPTFEQLVFNKPAVSHTHVMENDEHCDVKDIREYFKIFRKQNINFVEILFTNYYIVNEKYSHYWDILVDNREYIAKYDMIRAVHCMGGMASEKRHALCHEYPSRMFMIEKYQYDPKQLSHLLRIEDFLYKYIHGYSYSDCLVPSNREYLLEVKRTGAGMSKDAAIETADAAMENINKMIEDYCSTHEKTVIPLADSVLDEALYGIMFHSLEWFVFDELEKEYLDGE